MSGMTLGVSQLAVAIKAFGKEVVNQPMLHVEELGDYLLCPSDGLVDRVEDLRDAPLLLRWRQREANRVQFAVRDRLLSRSDTQRVLQVVELCARHPVEEERCTVTDRLRGELGETRRCEPAVQLRSNQESLVGG